MFSGTHYLAKKHTENEGSPAAVNTNINTENSLTLWRITM